jgi:hypothetical protein
MWMLIGRSFLWPDPMLSTAPSFLRPIQRLISSERSKTFLGQYHLNIHTATAAPMTDLFDLSQKNWNFKAIASDYLKNTQLPIPTGAYVSKSIPRPTHDAAYWADKTKEFDFSVEDHLGNVEKFNRIVWQGLKEALPYPVQRTGADLRQNRQQLLLRTIATASAGN